VINKKDFDNYFRDTQFVGCAVRSPDIIYLLGQKKGKANWRGEWPDDDELDKHLDYVWFREDGEVQYGAGSVSGFFISYIAVQQTPKPHALMIDLPGDVYRFGSGMSEIEPRLQRDDRLGPLRGVVTNVQAIDGTVYCTSRGRGICRRAGLGEWEPLIEGLPELAVEQPKRSDFGFEDIAGFDGNDIYAVGGSGDVWHFDGSMWNQCAFPFASRLSNVCCADDGNVYIAGGRGVIYKGRDDRWEMVFEGDIQTYYHDIAWFQDRLWVTNDGGLWVLTDSGMERPDVPEFVMASMGYLAADFGVMVVAGFWGASMHNGKEWISLIDFKKLYRKYGIFHLRLGKK